MKLMFPLPHVLEIPAVVQPWELSVTGPDQLRIARRGEELGYDMIAIPEHFAIPPEDQHTGHFWLHSTTAQAALAGATSRIMLNSTITILPFNHPIIHAKALATADWLSGGRMAVTFGLGSIEREFSYFGVPFHERGAIADEYLEAIVALWTQDRPSFEGRYVQFRDVGFLPKPVQRPHLPIWIGGDSKAALRRVARFGSGWIITFRTGLDEVAAKIDAIKSDPAWTDRPLEVAYGLVNLRMKEGHGPSGNAWPDPTSAQQLIDALGRFRDQGVTMSAVPVPPVNSVEAYLDHAQWVMEEVKPHL
ncbi:MAG TPA: TIGR03619 family F420-dependent LLM class oxidoreductase [Novosphingobium sp.]|nr:TIGR03619 family F420-dependent LLM class oxidoreductase [Novosphingobium sp.]